MIMNPAGGGGLRIIATYSGTRSLASDDVTINLPSPASFVLFGAKGAPYNSPEPAYSAFVVLPPGSSASNSGVQLTVSADGNTLRIEGGQDQAYMYWYYIYVIG